MSPGKQDYPELVHDVRVGHVEVVFEGANADEAAKLREGVSICLGVVWG